MRKRDKLKNIEQANLMLEQSYLKSKGLLIEGKRVKLSDSLLGQIDQIIDETIPKEIDKMAYVTGYQHGNPKTFVGSLIYNELGNKDTSTCKVFIIFDPEQKFSGQYKAYNSKVLSDNVILLNLTSLQSYGSVKPKDLKNTYEKGKEYYRDVLVHEITHAMDPKINFHVTKSTWANYNPYIDPKTEEYFKKYLSHDIEVIAQSTSFFNRIIRSVKQFKKEYGNDPEKLKMLDKNLDLFLQAFATSNFGLILNNEFLSLMEGTVPSKLVGFLEKITGKIEQIFLGSKNIIQSTIVLINQDPLLHDLVFSGKSNEFYVNLTRVMFYKKYNPKAWKSFLTKLYNTVQEAKEIINS